MMEKKGKDIDIEQIERTAEVISKNIFQMNTEDEAAELQSWRDADPANEKLFDRIMQENWFSEKVEKWNLLDPQKAAQAMRDRITADYKKKTVKRLSLLRWTAAAAVLALAFLSWELVKYHQKYEDLLKKNNELSYVESIHHGETKATLVTDNGQTVVLGNSDVSNSEAIKAAREKSEKSAKAREMINNLSIPRGGEFHIVLEDGTEVWLNAESVLKYPDCFDGNTRDVELTGEAYFKVAKDKGGRQFRVKTAGQMVCVYGTEFNVLSYEEDECVYTTLVNGCISLKKDDGGESELILTPGHQAAFAKGSGTTKVKPVSTDVVTSWKNGMFVFEEQTLEQIMRQLSRWYDFSYEFMSQEAANTVFMGRIARYGKFGDVLEVLEKSGNLNFVVKDDKIQISKKPLTKS